MLTRTRSKGNSHVLLADWYNYFRNSLGFKPDDVQYLSTSNSSPGYGPNMFPQVPQNPCKNDHSRVIQNAIKWTIQRLTNNTADRAENQLQCIHRIVSGTAKWTNQSHKQQHVWIPQTQCWSTESSTVICWENNNKSEAMFTQNHRDSFQF